MSAGRAAWKTPLLFAGCAAAVVGLFALIVLLLGRYATWQAESFGDRRLGTPAAVECEIARALLKDHRDHDRAALLRSVGASDEKMHLRAFAWRSAGAHVGRGVDWRKCRGLGAYARKLGMAGMGTGEAGPLLYVSRAAFRSAGEAEVFETFTPPEMLDRLGPHPPPPPVRAWRVELRRDAAGRWRVQARNAVEAAS